MKINAYCMTCLVNRQLESIEKFEDEQLKANFMRKVMNIISQSDEDASTPEVYEPINELYQDFFGVQNEYKAIKDKYNYLMLEKEAEIWNRIQSSNDNLKEALKYSRVGNYIDFATGNIDNERLNNLIYEAHNEAIDEIQYKAFLKDLNNARELVFITDNCGEIVLDKLLIKCIKSAYPLIHITVIVRGKIALNDATMEDAKTVGLTELTDVIDNGTGIPGTSLNKINQKAKEILTSANIIISKGQGNFETLNGCGLNIYYLFLCKCDWFTKRFNMEKYKGVFINEKSIKI